MIDNIYKNIPTKHQGFIALVLGILLLFGSLGRLGVIQTFFHVIMIVAGVNLILWGIDKSNILSIIKKLTK